LKVDNVGVKQMSSGRLFQATGPATQNTRLPICSFVLGTNKSPRLESGTDTWLKIVVHCYVCYSTYTRLRDRAFPVAGPRLWNSLPSNLRQSDLTLHQFRRALKTYLFGRLRLQHLATFCL